MAELEFELENFLKCLACGRFMRIVTYFHNEHLDSEDWYWKCSNERCRND